MQGESSCHSSRGQTDARRFTQKERCPSRAFHRGSTGARYLYAIPTPELLMRPSYQQHMPSVIAALVLASACATTTPQPATSPLRNPTTSVNEPARMGKPSETLSGFELRAGNAPSLLAAVRSMRYEFLRPTTVTMTDGGSISATPSVYLNGAYSGELDALETIPISVVEEVRYIRATQAREQWGPRCRCPAGVIYVRTRSAQ